jgi:NAD(P)-dependent dehydrogenase (short-subunit alcohol dehydrogenase family)
MTIIQHPAAVVIGASGGIGAAVARQLEGSGRFAVVHALSRAGTGFDLEDEASIAAAAARVAEGPAPALVFVATGVLHHGHEPERSWRALDADHLLRDYRINAVGPALVAKHFLPLLPRDRRAVFTALSARVGSIGDNRLGGWHSYRASKAALNMILRNLAVELGRTHPQAVVVCLHPGTVATAFTAKYLGTHPAVPPDEAAQNLLAVLDSLTPAQTGGFFDAQGRVVPW